MTGGEEIAKDAASAEPTLADFDLDVVLSELAAIRSRVKSPVDAVAIVREGRDELEADNHLS